MAGTGRFERGSARQYSHWRSARLLARAFLVAELVDDHGARNGGKRQRIHVGIVHDVLAQARVVGVQHTTGGDSRDIAVAVVAGMKQQGGAALDADVAQAEKQRAVRLAMAPDAKQFATGIGAVDLRLEILDPPALAILFRRGGERGGGDHQQKSGDETGEIFHGASSLRFRTASWARSLVQATGLSQTSASSAPWPSRPRSRGRAPAHGYAATPAVFARSRRLPRPRGRTPPGWTATACQSPTVFARTAAPRRGFRPRSRAARN